MQPELIAEAEWPDVGRNLAVDDRAVCWVEKRASCTRRRPAFGDVGSTCIETTTESRLMRAPR